MHLAVLFIDIMAVVRADEGNSRFLCYLYQLGISQPLLLNSMVLYFNIIIALAEYAFVIERLLLCALVIPCKQAARQLARKAGGKAD